MYDTHVKLWLNRLRTKNLRLSAALWYLEAYTESISWSTGFWIRLWLPIVDRITRSPAESRKTVPGSSPERKHDDRESVRGRCGPGDSQGLTWSNGVAKRGGEGSTFGHTQSRGYGSSMSSICTRKLDLRTRCFDSYRTRSNHRRRLVHGPIRQLLAICNSYCPSWRCGDLSLHSTELQEEAMPRYQTLASSLRRCRQCRNSVLPQLWVQKKSRISEG